MNHAVKRMRRLFVVILAAVAAIALVAGCGGGDSSTSTATGSTGTDTGSGTDAAQVQPGQGGTLTWALGETSGWDPVLSSAGYDTQFLALVYDGLTQLDPKGEPGPGMAKSWEYSKDGKVMTLHLADGLSFSDGAPFNADAVKTNLERAKTTEGSTAAASLATIKSVKVVDPSTVQLNLTQPDYQLPLVFGGRAGMMVSPKAIETNAKALKTKPVGAGPFTLTNYVQGSGGSASLKRNPGYRNADQILLAGVDLKITSNPQVILSGLQSKDINLATIGAQQAPAAKSSGLVLKEFPTLGIVNVMVNSAQKPLDNPKVVEAINYALDREAMIKAFNAGVGHPVSQAFPPGYIANDPNIPAVTPDPAKVKQLLSEAGYADGKGPELTVTGPSDYGSYPALIVQIQQQLQDAGFQVKTNPIPTAQVVEQGYLKHELAFTVFEFAGRESPVAALEVQYGKDGLLNPCRCESPELRSAIDKARATPVDDPSYEATIQAASAAAAQTSANLMLFDEPATVAYGQNVHGVEPWINFQRLNGVYVSG